jgi:hypothetical protein
MSGKLDALVQTFVKEAESIGLYLRDIGIATPSQESAAMTGMEHDRIEDAIKEGHEFVIMASFVVGDVAWTDATLYPEKVAEEREFKKIVPDEREIVRQKLIDDLKAGRDPFSED